MNVYEAIAKSPLNMAWHEKSGLIRLPGESCIRTKIEHPDGWQPLAVLEDAEQWKQRAEKAEEQLYEACKQLAGEYTLGEPLTAGKKMQRYIAIHNETGDVHQNQFFYDGQAMSDCWTYYADPRPLPKLPEPKEEPKLFRSYGADYHLLTDEGRRRLERLLGDAT